MSLPPFPYPSSPTYALQEVISPGDPATTARTEANNAWALLDDGLQNLAQDQFGGLLTQFFGAGRFLLPAGDPTVGAPVAGTGLTINQPNGLFVVQGQLYTINNSSPTYQVIVGLLPNQSSVYAFAGINQTNGLLYTQSIWQFSAFPTSPTDLATVAGLLYLGNGVTGPSSVTSWTSSNKDGFAVIYPRGTTASGGGGGGGVSQADLTAALAALTATFNAELAALTASVNTQLASNGRLPATSDNDVEANRVANLIIGLGQQYAPAINDFEGSYAKANQFGDGTTGTPDYLGPTTMTKVDDGWTP